MAGKEEKASLEAGTKVSFAVSLQNLVQLGEQIGYSGKELQEFIKQQQERDREERHLEREAKREKASIYFL